MSAAPTVAAYIGLGSNLGDRLQSMRQAATEVDAALSAEPGSMTASSLYETSALGGPVGQPPYLNAVVRVVTVAQPRCLLETLLEIETVMGRTRAFRYESRIIDLDLLLCGQGRIDEPGLVVPHPRLVERRFVLEPLAELAPDVIHPTLGSAIAELADLARHAKGQSVRRVQGPSWLAAEPRPAAVTLDSGAHSP